MTDSRKETYPDKKNVNRVVAQTPEMAQEFLDLIGRKEEWLKRLPLVQKIKEMFSAKMDFSRYPEEMQKLEEEVGAMLGYPTTSLDAYLGKTERSNEPYNKFGAYVHSANFDKEEVENYDKPLEEAVNKYAPVAGFLLS